MYAQIFPLMEHGNNKAIYYFGLLASPYENNSCFIAKAAQREQVLKRIVGRRPYDSGFKLSRLLGTSEKNSDQNRSTRSWPSAE